MLFILRKIRRSFFLPGKVRTYLAYAAGEIVLIVVGILLALQISEWNQDRKDRAEETGILLRPKAEFVLNQENLENLTALYQNVASRMEVFSGMIKPEPEDYPAEQIFDLIRILQQRRSYQPISGELSSLNSTGKIALISNQALSKELNKWPSTIGRIENIYELMYNELPQTPLNLQDYRTKDLQYYTRRVNIGKSDFPSDLNELLSSPVMEDVVVTKLIWSNLIVTTFERLLGDQQSILDLIEAELAERGMGTEP